MSHYVYIIYSPGKDRFYVGESVEPLGRLAQHNNRIYQNSFTKFANDWIIFWWLECNSRSQALQIESHIKRMKSKQYYQNLVKYPEISEKLLSKYE